MCGIIGLISNGSTVENFFCFENIIRGLEQLQNRGYDSAGICCINNEDKKFVIDKFISNNQTAVARLNQLRDRYAGCSVGIGHERWATTGIVSEANAHPHTDCYDKIALVHNGIIENYYELRVELEGIGVTFRSQTDTEVIASLIGMYYRQSGSVTEAISHALARLDGTWALVILCVDEPDTLYCARNGSPMLLGIGEDFMMLASEQSGFAGSVDKYVCLNDGDFIVLTRREGRVVCDSLCDYEVKEITIRDFVMTPEPYSHWTLKEINDQYEASARAIKLGGRLMIDNTMELNGLDTNRDVLLAANHLILLGCGTSYHACLRGAQFMRELAEFETVQVFDAGEFTELDIPRRGTSVLILLSQSGETKDVHRCVKMARDKGLFTVGVVNVVDSLIAREVNCGCYLNAGREVGVASTKSFTSQVIVLAMCAIWFSEKKGVNREVREMYIRDLRQLPSQIKAVIQHSENVSREVAAFLKDKRSCFVLGKGSMEPFAREAALKIKELSYIHAEGYSAVALKHGPFSLLDPETPVIVMNPGDVNYSRVNGTIEEVKSRNAPVVLITDRVPEMTVHNFLIVVPVNRTFQGVLHTIPTQMIAYYLAIYRGNNPDMPRNLAKSVTVY